MWVAFGKAYKSGATPASCATHTVKAKFGVEKPREKIKICFREAALEVEN